MTMAVVVAALAMACAAGGTPTPLASPGGATPTPTDSLPAATGQPAVPSAGCGTSAVRAGTTHASMAVNGLDRTWYLHVAAAHDGSMPLPLVVQLHGLGNDVTDMAGTGFDALGDKEGFVVVTPVGRGSMPRWLFELDSAALDVTAANPDIAFIGALFDRLEAELCLDTTRLYVAGISNGAFLTSALPCALADRVAAVAPVAGVVDFRNACYPKRPVPIIAFHGTADTALPLAGGFGPDVLASVLPETGKPFGDLPMLADPIWAVSIQDRMTGIAVRDGCAPQPVSETIATDADRLSWPCPAGMDVQLVLINGGWHDWPPDATPLIWDFFSAHPLPTPSST
jgi:polyhydroxybutyrate depolymerase